MGAVRSVIHKTMQIVNLKKKLDAMGVKYSEISHNEIEFVINSKRCSAFFTHCDYKVLGYTIDLYHDNASQETVRSFPSNFSQLIKRVSPLNN